MSDLAQIIGVLSIYLSAAIALLYLTALLAPRTAQRVIDLLTRLVLPHVERLDDRELELLNRRHAREGR